ncbi:MAG: alpha/beta fold hydrolase, partial [Jatrophihabitans sp.]|uniref:alpha/beta fold hydrolase n=1 Tax=Jatrophihabitans sp. TaxID=1932789 RepID=UPI003911E968
VVVLSTGDGITPAAKPPPGVASDVAAKIPTAGGITLSAEVITPKGPGPFPLVVMPGSWGSAATEYHLPGQQFAAQGYQVVGYAQRGFKGSGGTIDFAGPKTQADVATVINWALTHTRADGAHIGMLGISYGAGVSLLAAAAQPRIKAVVAMSGWGDLGQALAPNGTANVVTLHLLLDGYRSKRGALSPDLQRLADSLSSGNASEPARLLSALGKGHSAAERVAALNKNGPAIMLANAYQDSIVDPAQIVPFFNQLTTPRRLQLAMGDHGGPEAAGLQGKPDITFADGKRWLDRYLMGKQNGVDSAEPVQLVDEATEKLHGYRSWPKAASTITLGLPPWTQALTAGTDSGATSGPYFTQEPFPFQPPSLKMSAVQADHAFVWNGTTVERPTLISGSPSLRLAVAASASPTTLYAHLYDVDASGTATLMTYAPMSTAGGDVSFTLHPLAWTVASGHHLAVVIDTVDQRYLSDAPSGSSVTLGSTAQAPATLALPTG